MRWLRPFAVTALCASLAACSTSPTGRSQLLLLSDDQLNQMGQQAFAQYQRDVPTANQASHRYVQCITNAIVEDRLNEADCEPGFLLDGYPRTTGQVTALDAMVARTRSRPLPSGQVTVRGAYLWLAAQTALGAVLLLLWLLARGARLTPLGERLAPAATAARATSST